MRLSAFNHYVVSFPEDGWTLVYNAFSGGFATLRSDVLETLRDADAAGGFDGEGLDPDLADDSVGIVVASREAEEAAYAAWFRRLRDEAEEVPADVAYAVGPKEDVNTILESAAGAAKQAGVQVNTHAREGGPADSILDVAEQTKADVIVVGNKGMTGARRFLLGSVPNNISHHAPCSVLIVRTT